MKNAKVVIGANFGDEGKGLFTDFLSSSSKGDGLIVRFNGGAQAGHTVVKNGVRNVFSHMGSGSFNGSPTYLSEFFVSNPLLFLKEYKIFKEKNNGVFPDVFVDQNSLVTTPYDMFINQLLEQSRGSAKHGSCGVGFGETIERSLSDEYKIVVNDLYNKDVLFSKLVKIRNEYLKFRAMKMNVLNLLNNESSQYIFRDELIERFVEDCLLFTSLIKVTNKNILNRFEDIIFEGAQGLLLDQDYGYFPYVTRSNTGLKNVMEIIRDTDINNLDVIYATRAYLTRHGAGPFENELKELPYEHIVDKTNVFNLFQDGLRFSYLDENLLFNAIDNDLSVNKCEGVNVNTTLGISCVDQLDDRIKIYRNGELNDLNKEDYLDNTKRKYGRVLASFGEESNKIISV